MKIFTFLLVFVFGIFVFYVFTHGPQRNYDEVNIDTVKSSNERPGLADLPAVQTVQHPRVEDTIPVVEVVAPELKPNTLISFAKTLIGTPYRYASTDPRIGFDCSGFITYVFNHFNVKVPRSSKDFEHIGKEIPVNKSKQGDLILFTGTDSTERIIGHMGIVISNNDSLRFIHSSSGKANGVVITALNNYYRSRFVKTIRVLDN
ncbi:MAG: C40 family peptidase [Ginsengibacter sp.]